MLFNASMHRLVKEATDTIAHELIHYELADAGKFSGHGRDFRKRAQQLGILGRIELDLCRSGEEVLSRPHTVETRRVSLGEVYSEMVSRLEKLEALALRVPMNLRTALYFEVRNLRNALFVYHAAVENGEDYVLDDVIKPRRGRRGKPAVQLVEEGRQLHREIKALRGRDKLDQKGQKQLETKTRRLEQIEARLQKDYEIEDFRWEDEKD